MISSSGPGSVGPPPGRAARPFGPGNLHSCMAWCCTETMTAQSSLDALSRESGRRRGRGREGRNEVARDCWIEGCWREEVGGSGCWAAIPFSYTRHSLQVAPWGTYKHHALPTSSGSNCCKCMKVQDSNRFGRTSMHQLKLVIRGEKVKNSFISSSYNANGEFQETGKTMLSKLLSGGLFDAKYDPSKSGYAKLALQPKGSRLFKDVPEIVKVQWAADAGQVMLEVQDVLKER
eukprot:749938-Hanusia_phi.AAC.6